MTRLTTITPGCRERISASLTRLVADYEGADKLVYLDRATDVAVAIENRVTELCRPTPKDTP